MGFLQPEDSSFNLEGESFWPDLNSVDFRQDTHDPEKILGSVGIEYEDFIGFAMQMPVFYEIAHQEVVQGKSYDSAEMDVWMLTAAGEKGFAACLRRYFHEGDSGFKEYFEANQPIFVNLASIYKNPDLKRSFDKLLKEYSAGNYQFDNKSKVVGFKKILPDKSEQDISGMDAKILGLIHALGEDLLKSVSAYIKKNGLELPPNQIEILKEIKLLRKEFGEAGGKM